MKILGWKKSTQFTCPICKHTTEQYLVKEKFEYMEPEIVTSLGERCLRCLWQVDLNNKGVAKYVPFGTEFK